MEMYASASSFETNLTLETRSSFRDVSFSSYLNKAEENMIMELTNQAQDIPNDHHYSLGKKSEEDEEIGVFGAEKYFKGEIEDRNKKKDPRFLSANDVASKMYQQQEEIEEFDRIFPVKQRIDWTNTHTPSVRSNASWNSRSGLLPRTNQAPGKIEKESKTRSFLASFGCNCIDKRSTEISERRFIHAKEISKPPTRMIDSDKKTDPLSTKLADKNIRNDYFSFPVLNSDDLSSNLKSGNLAVEVQGDINGGRLSLGRKLSPLNDWDVDIPMEDETYIPSSGIYNGDIDSDTSSDLFEIESFSTTGHSSFLAHRTSESNCYAPSEVSIDWSVVTASAADFSVASHYEEVRTGGGGWRNSDRKVPITDKKDDRKKRPGILSGCTSHKAVRVAGDEYKVSGGGGPGGRRRFSDSMVVGRRFPGVNNVTRFDPTRGNYGSDVCPMSDPKRRYASQLLYVQQ